MNTPRDESLTILSRAKQTLETAEYDLQGGHYLAVANRAYYAIYYCMGAVLHLEQVSTRTHQGTRSKFSELFIRTQKFPVAFSEMLQKAFDYRQKADYDFTMAITREEAEILVRNATAFILATQEYLREQD